VVLGGAVSCRWLVVLPALSAAVTQVIWRRRVAAEALVLGQPAARTAGGRTGRAKRGEKIFPGCVGRSTSVACGSASRQYSPSRVEDSLER
jgi:hypothetical protein